MSKDWASDPAAREWLLRVQRELPRKIEQSAIVCSLVPKDGPDAKFAVELGMAIMLDKPIMLVVPPGTHVPEHLARVADDIVEGALDAKETARRIDEACHRLTPKE